MRIVRSIVRRPGVAGACVVLLCLGASRESAAQVFVSPLIGYDFGGDSGCPAIADCKDKSVNLGVAVGVLGPVIGTEIEFAYADDFFGEIPRASSSVLTVMGNVLLAPKLGPVQPYALAGLGLLKIRAELSAGGLLEASNNHFGWNAGGGLIVFFGRHVGVRGDVRYFHAFQDLELLGLEIGGTKLDFGRASAAVVFKF